MKKTLKKGFTLVELIVVIAIIAILAAVSVAGYFGFMAQARQSRADTEGAQVRTALQAQGAKTYKFVKIGTENDKYNNLTFSLSTNGLQVSGFAADSNTDVLKAADAVHLLNNAYTFVVNENTPTAYALTEVITADNKASLHSVTFKTGTTIVESFVYESAENITSSIAF